MMIVRGKLAFIEVKAIGECDETGKAVLSFGYKGKMTAHEDRPLDVIRYIIGEFLPFCHYTHTEAFEADLAALKRAVDGIVLDPPKDKISAEPQSP